MQADFAIEQTHVYTSLGIVYTQLEIWIIYTRQLEMWIMYKCEASFIYPLAYWKLLGKYFVEIDV